MARQDPYHLFKDTEQPEYDIIISVSVSQRGDIVVQNGRALDRIAVKLTGHTISNERGSWTKLYFSADLGSVKRNSDDDNRKLGMTKEILVKEHHGNSKIIRQGLKDFVNAITFSGKLKAKVQLTDGPWPVDVRLRVEFYIDEEGDVHITGDTKFIRAYSSYNLRAAGWSFRCDSWHMDKQNICNQYGDYLDMFDSIEQAVLTANKNMEELDWVYYMSFDGEKQLHPDMLPPVRGILRAAGE